MTDSVFKIERLASLAPMAGVTDSAFRQLCRQHGAAFCTSEMISAKALTMGDKKTAKLMEFAENERPYGIQLFGYDADVMAEAAAIIERDFGPDFIDINMGCPTPKITSNGSGSALMKDSELAAHIVECVCGAVSIPVSVKIRAGYSETTAPKLAPLLERAGAGSITVHGRTRDRMYRPPVDLDVIRDVKKSVGVPVIGNGDIGSGRDALHMLEYTGCDAVMIGRGALGNPFIFGEVNAAVTGDALPAAPTLAERMDTFRTQAKITCENKGEYIAMREMRKHAAWYIKGVQGAAAFRARSSEIGSMDDLEQFIEMVLETL